MKIKKDSVVADLYKQIAFWKKRALEAERSNRLLAGKVVRRLSRIEARIVFLDSVARLIKKAGRI